MNCREGNQGVEVKQAVDLAADTVFSEILPRLPASSLLRLRAVCQSWNSVIRADPAFARTNLDHVMRRMPTSCRITFFDPHIQELSSLDEAMSRPKSTLFSTHEVLTVSPPCNGLVCIYHRCANTLFGLQLFNLTTKELLPLPDPQSPPNTRTFHLGYGPSTDKYKVVCHAVSRSECRVLTVGSDTRWRRITGTEIPDNNPSISVAIGRFLFRIIQNKNGLNTIPVLFDVKEEKFRLLSLPISSSPRMTLGNVLDIEGKPSFVEEYYSGSIFTDGLHICMLMDVDREVWIRRCIMPAIGGGGGGLDEVRIRGYPNSMVWSKPVLIYKDKVLLHFFSHFYCLHLQSGGLIDRWEEVHYGGVDRLIYHCVHPFVENLISLKGMLTSA